ncbi:MAG: sulfotransferase [Geminicoccaceae bacterium]
MSPTPVYLFSMPRGGSTWLQRLMGSHADIATLNEPWFLLPLVYMRRRRGISSEYWQDTCGKAVNELFGRLDGGEEVFDEAVRAFAGKVHEAAATGGERYFLDKTPRYGLIADDLVRIFPNARFVFLWRNPLSVLSSMLELSGNRWLVPRFDIDLVEGWPRLVDLARRLGDRAVCVRYEDLVDNRDGELARVFTHLGLDFDPACLAGNRSGVVPGLMGDAKSDAMQGLDRETQVSGWRQKLRGPLRRRWSKRYLQALGAGARPRLHGLRRGHDRRPRSNHRAFRPPRPAHRASPATPPTPTPFTACISISRPAHRQALDRSKAAASSA